MLPARFHVEVAEDCISLNKNLITPSYISPEMKTLNERAANAGIVIMNEIGVDPGIDHMSAMKIIDKIKENGDTLHSFKSFCGGLWLKSTMIIPGGINSLGTLEMLFLPEKVERLCLWTITNSYIFLTIDYMIV